MGCSHRQAHSSCNACWDALGSVPHNTITACSGVLCRAALCSDCVPLSFVSFPLFWRSCFPHSAVPVFSSRFLISLFLSSGCIILFLNFDRWMIRRSKTSQLVALLCFSLSFKLTVLSYAINWHVYLFPHFFIYLLLLMHAAARRAVVPAAPFHPHLTRSH